MKVVVNGKSITLDSKSFLAQGGEGAVYVKGKTAYKIYTEPKNMIAVGKIQELGAITSPNVIRPKDIVFNSKNKPIGYTMDFIKKSYPLCQVFTKGFKNRHSLKPAMGLGMIANMQETVTHIHDKKILVVDMNEMNFLVDDKFKEVYFIDVDSYQTPSFHATALMESVRDRHSKPNVFNEGTDWFAWAIVSFQVMSGIHPYKGSHPSLKGFDARMLGNMSVYSNEVKTPKVVSDFRNLIPPALNEWYEKVFQDGLRIAPPTDYKNAVIKSAFVVTTVVGTNNFTINVYKEFDHAVVSYFYYMGEETIITAAGAKYMSSDVMVEPSAHAVFDKSVPIYVTLKNDILYVDKYLGTEQEFQVDEYMTYNNRIYYRNGENIMELIEFNNRYVTKLVSTTMPNSTKMYDGVSIQNMLGSFRADVFPDTGICYHVKLDQLDGYQIIEAKHERNILMIVGVKNGQYDRFIYSLNKGDIISKRKVEDIIFNGLNFTVLDKNIVVQINEDDQVEIFTTTNVNKVKLVDDSSINGSMKLFSKGSQVLFADGKKIYKLEMSR